MTTHEIRANNDRGRLYGTGGLHVCATVHPRRLPTKDGYHPRASAQNRTIPTKASTFQKIHCRVGSTKNQVVMEVQPVFLSPLMEQLTGLGQVNALQMIHHLFNSYGAIDKTDLKEHALNMVGPYEPTEPLARLIDQLEKEREFARAGGQKIADAMMVSKGITLLVWTSTFNEEIKEWIRKTTDLKTWAGFKTYLHNIIYNRGEW